MDSKWPKNSLDLNLNPFHHVTEVPGGTKLAEELSRVSSENVKLNEMLTEICEKYSALQGQLRDLMNKNTTINNTNINNESIASPSSRKRKSMDRNMIESTSSSDDESCKFPREIKSKISTVYARADSTDKTLVVKDGYHWRKYGQKVTRDNPSPRAYFKCSFSPSCPVKKKVQRSAEDPSILVVTYEGKHSHISPSSKPQYSIGQIKPDCSIIRSPGSTITLDLVEPAKEVVTDQHSPISRQIFVQQMASSLTMDPNFTAALAAAISGRIVDHYDHVEHS